MNDEPALTAAVIADPADDTLRLAYADFLQESGQSQRAEFIRAQIDLANGGDELRVGEAVTRGKYLRDVCRNALVSHPAAPPWLGGPQDPLINSHLHRDVLSDELAIRCFGARVRPATFTFNRGFVERILCDAEAWVRNSERFLKLHPLAEVRLTTIPATDRFPFIPGRTESWDEIMLRGDRAIRCAFPEPQIQHGANKLFHENGGVARPNDFVRALLRLRWPTLRIELMPDAVLSLQIETAEDPLTFMNLTNRINSGPVMGWPAYSLLLVNAHWDRTSPPGAPSRWRVRLEFAQTADMAVFMTGNGEMVYDAADFTEVLHRFGNVVVSEE